MSVRLVGPAAPIPAFSFTPAAPERLQVVTFDASATTVNGAICGDDCTYTWRFGNEQNATGRIVTYQFQNAATYTVQLTVTSPSGMVATTSQIVTVSAETMTLIIGMSPANPRVNESVMFDGRSSTATGGATIVDYQWDFGDNDTGSGPTASNTYPDARTYTVRLTVRDSLGRTATRTATVAVAEPD
jgi:PKD repeat protein